LTLFLTVPTPFPERRSVPQTTPFLLFLYPEGVGTVLFGTVSPFFGVIYFFTVPLPEGMVIREFGLLLAGLMNVREILIGPN
jgi:hypothetical protein